VDNVTQRCVPTVGGQHNATEVVVLGPIGGGVYPDLSPDAIHARLAEMYEDCVLYFDCNDNRKHEGGEVMCTVVNQTCVIPVHVTTVAPCSESLVLDPLLQVIAVGLPCMWLVGAKASSGLRV
jgi:hypothetical protein